MHLGVACETWVFCDLLCRGPGLSCSESAPLSLFFSPHPEVFIVTILEQSVKEEG